MLLFALKGEIGLMDLLQSIAKDTTHFCLGLYGIGIVYLIGSTITDVIGGFVNWIGIKIKKYRIAGSK